MSDEEDAVEALLDELAEAPPDDALDAAAERLAEDALAAACADALAEQLADAASWRGGKRAGFDLIRSLLPLLSLEVYAHTCSDAADTVTHAHTPRDDAHSPLRHTFRL